MNDGTEIDILADDAYEIPPGHDAWVVGDTALDTVEFTSARVFGIAPDEDDERTLATILFTDIVDSTATLARVGDTAWRRILLDHNDLLRSELDRFRGREIVTTGDGFLALFDGAARAVRCAAAMTDGVRSLGIQIRAGLHTGEVAIAGGNARGVAVHAAARVAALAGPSEVLVSGTTRDLLDGSGLAFEDRGPQELKGLEGVRQVYALVRVIPGRRMNAGCCPSTSENCARQVAARTFSRDLIESTALREIGAAASLRSSPGISAARHEGFAPRHRHVIVRRSSEVLDMADSRPAVVEQPTERAQAFLRLADDRLDASYRLARAILRDPAEAEDATHDALIQAWRKWSTLRDPSRFDHWFNRILVNTCRDRLRASRRQPRDISNEVEASGDDPFVQTDLRDTLTAGLAALSAEQRVVVALRYYRDLSIDQIAVRLGIPVGTVQSRLHYALKRLHAAIDAADDKGTTR